MQRFLLMVGAIPHPTLSDISTTGSDTTGSDITGSETTGSNITCSDINKMDQFNLNKYLK